jgi:hypothetical protein
MINFMDYALSKDDEQMDRIYERLAFHHLLKRAHSMTAVTTPTDFSIQVAEAVRANKGAFAYVFVLEQIEIATEGNYQLWRDVLNELERKDDETPRVQPTTERSE